MSLPSVKGELGDSGCSAMLAIRQPLASLTASIQLKPHVTALLLLTST
jgi:hypothetical protein